MQRKSRSVLIVVGLAIVVLIVMIIISRSSKSAQTILQTAVVQRGDVVATISATGTVEPEEVVDVGAQVAGLIKAFGTDVNGKTIDYGSAVDIGTVLSRIDD